ncbi:MAG: tetratricopeptide repeat protein [Treponema sp.]|nr:tetratricopeptide repeat protein [Treponema sp.]
MKKIAIVLLGLFCISLFTGCKDSGKKILKKRIENMEKSSGKPMSEEEIKAAIDQYYDDIEEIQKKNMQIAIWYKMLGTRMLDKKEYGTALQYFQKALEITPDNSVLYFYAGECAAFLGNASLDIDASGNLQKRINYYQMAEDAYLKALAIDDKYVYALLGIGILYSYQMDNSQAAIPYLERLLAIDKKNIDAMFVLARCYYLTKQYDMALQYYDLIIDTSKVKATIETAEENKQKVLSQAYEN